MGNDFGTAVGGYFYARVSECDSFCRFCHYNFRNFARCEVEQGIIYIFGYFVKVAQKYGYFVCGKQYLFAKYSKICECFHIKSEKIKIFHKFS